MCTSHILVWRRVLYAFLRYTWLNRSSYNYVHWFTCTKRSWREGESEKHFSQGMMIRKSEGIIIRMQLSFPKILCSSHCHVLREVSVSIGMILRVCPLTSFVLIFCKWSKETKSFSYLLQLFSSKTISLTSFTFAQILTEEHTRKGHESVMMKRFVPQITLLPPVKKITEQRRRMKRRLTKMLNAEKHQKW